MAVILKSLAPAAPPPPPGPCAYSFKFVSKTIDANVMLDINMVKLKKIDRHSIMYVYILYLDFCFKQVA